MGVDELTWWTVIYTFIAQSCFIERSNLTHGVIEYIQDVQLFDNVSMENVVYELGSSNRIQWIT